MSGYTRSEFLGLSGRVVGGGVLGGGVMGGGVLGAGTLVAPGVRGDASPDLVVVNARVYTIDEQLPRASAFAVKHGRFVAVGTDDDIRNLADRDTRVLDAGQAVVTPGFIDAHSHPSGVRELTQVDLDVRTIADVKRLMAERARETPPDQWVIGFKYDDTKVVDEATGRYRRITRWDLDEAVPNQPARVHHRGGHIAWYNSKAFELAGIAADVEDPPGGRFGRTDDGELNGLAEQRATGMFSGIASTPPTTPELRRQGVAHMARLMTRAGLTSVHQTGGGAADLRALQEAYAADELLYRMYFFPSGGAHRTLRDAGIRTGFGDDRLRIGAVKFTADGSASGRTMRMSEPYVGRPDDYGILMMSQDDIHEAVEEAHRAGWQVAIHANGDVAIDLVLNAYERVQRNWPRQDPRHRIEHCTLVNPDLLRRIAELGVVPAPFYTYVHYHGNKWVEYGEERLEWMFAHRSFLDHGIPVAPASDYVPGPFEPLMAIQSMVTRKDTQGRVWGPSQRISVAEALRICTVNGAHASFEEDLKGSITPGKLADFVMLGEDPHEVDPDRIKEIPVVRTVVGGRVVHEG